MLSLRWEQKINQPGLSENCGRVPTKSQVLKAHCREADWVNNITKKKRVRQRPVI